MKTLFTKKTIAITVAAILIAAVTIVSVNVFGNSGFITNAANALSVPLKRIASSAAQTFEGIYGSIDRYESLKEDYEKALQELQQLRRDYREYTEATAELERLYALLGFRDRHKDFIFDPGIIVGWTASNWSSTFTISRGTANSDVVPGDSVITEHGVLIGRVKDVRETTSTVISVFDTTFSAAVTIGEAGGTATAKGDFTLMGSGHLKLDLIVDETLIVPGDTVVTSGRGGVFPTGLVIGEVTEIIPNNTGIGHYAIVKPLLDPELISHIYIITDFEIME